MSKPNWKPCPWCGYFEPKCRWQRDASDYGVECGSCNAHGPAASTEAKAIGLWNALPRRTDAAPGMSDGELIARAILQAVGLLEHATGMAAGGGRSSDPHDPYLAAELDRRADARKAGAS